jgi:thiol-disulfide isomerase/thioredoxin
MKNTVWLLPYGEHGNTTFNFSTMKFLFITITIKFCFVFFSYGQTLQLNISKETDSVNNPANSTIYLYSRTPHVPGEPFYSSEGDTVIHYSVYQFLIQSKSNLSRYDSIRLLVGYCPPDMIMMVDKNRNCSFSDDPVYKMSPLQFFIDGTDFKSRLPVIGIDSVLIEDQDGTSEFKELKLKFCPSPGNGKFYTDTSQLAGTKDFNLELYPVNYFLSTPFNYRGSSYQLKIVPNPITSSIYPLINSSVSQALLMIIKLSPQKRLVASEIISKLLDQKEHLPFEDNNLSIIEADFSKNRIKISLDSAEQKPIKANIGVISKAEYSNSVIGKKVHIDPLKKEFTILEFSGSWCKPCIEIIPEVKALQAKINNANTQFITVDAESNLNDAKKFQRKYNLTQTIVFQNLDCKEPDCLIRLFNVHGFPTFIVIDNAGNILFRETGDTAIKHLAAFLKKSSSLKE